MGDMGDIWREAKPLMKEESKQRRHHNRTSSRDLLASRGIAFESRNEGAHLIVKGRDCVIDFWPGTGKYIARDGRKGRGVRNLLKLCEQRQP